MKRMLRLALAALLPACSEVADDSALHNDSLAVIPIRPGTAPAVLEPSDTQPSRLPDSVADTSARNR